MKTNKNTCDKCNEPTWPNQDLCPQCEIELRQERDIKEYDKIHGDKV